MYVKLFFSECTLTSLSVYPFPTGYSPPKKKKRFCVVTTDLMGPERWQKYYYNYNMDFVTSIVTKLANTSERAKALKCLLVKNFF